MSEFNETAEYLDGFQAEFCFRVFNGCVTKCELVFNESFDNENRVIFSLPKFFRVDRLMKDGFIMQPSYLHLFISSEVEFGILFTDPVSQSGNHYTEFLGTLWDLSRTTVRPDIKKSDCDDLAGALSDVMDQLAEIDSIQDIDVTKYFGTFF